MEPKEGKGIKVLVALFFMAASLLAIYLSKNWRTEVIRFPLMVAILLFVLSLADLLVVLLLPEQKREAAIDFESTADVEPALAFRRTAEIFGWMMGLGLLIVLLSFALALPFFVFLYVKVMGRYGWAFSLMMGLVAWVFLYGLFVWALSLPFPDGLLMQWLGLSF